MRRVLLKSGVKIGVIALGGNAILRKGQPASPDIQMANLREAVKNLEGAQERYHSFALTHGNGPQVGNDLIRSYSASEHEGVAELELTDCVANTQGRIGHWLTNELKHNPSFADANVACIMTHVYVNKNSFTDDEYTKYVGPWRKNDDETRAKLDARGIHYRSPSGNEENLRRVVPSPEPYSIEEIEIINRLLSRGFITICCGGGGIPVYDPEHVGNIDGTSKSDDHFVRSDVVIDKDRASSVLAVSLLDINPTIDVEFVILADIRGLYKSPEMLETDYIPSMSYEQLTAFLADNKLDPGSIGPKVEAIHAFLENGGRHAWLGPLDDFEAIFDPDSGVGTHFHRTQQMKLFGEDAGQK